MGLVLLNASYMAVRMVSEHALWKLMIPALAFAPSHLAERAIKISDASPNSITAAASSGARRLCAAALVSSAHVVEAAFVATILPQIMIRDTNGLSSYLRFHAISAISMFVCPLTAGLLFEAKRIKLIYGAEVRLCARMLCKTKQSRADAISKAKLLGDKVDATYWVSQLDRLFDAPARPYAALKILNASTVLFIVASEWFLYSGAFRAEWSIIYLSIASALLLG